MKNLSTNALFIFLVFVSFNLLGQSSTQSKEVYYNQALQAFEEGKLPEATQNLIRSNKLGSLSEAEVLWTKIERDLPVEFRPIDRVGERTLDTFINYFPSNTFALLALLFSIGLAVSFLYWFLKERRYNWMIIGASCLLLAVLSLLCTLRRNQIRTLPVYVAKKSVEIRYSPSTNAKVTTTIPKATQVTSEDFINGFFLVRLPNNETGWIIKEDLLSTAL